MNDWRIILVLVAVLLWVILGQDRQKAMHDCQQIQSTEVCEWSLR